MSEVFRTTQPVRPEFVQAQVEFCKVNVKTQKPQCKREPIRSRFRKPAIKS